MLGNIVLRDYICSATGKYKCNNPRVNLYIYASEFCPASCNFCPGYSKKHNFDFSKFKESFSELHNKQFINRISITGGEPLYDLDTVNKILKLIYDISGDYYDVSVSTNGFNLLKLKDIEYFSVLNDIHISRHSENDVENDKIFGMKTPTLVQIQKETKNNPNKYSFSCNLIKGFVDSVGKVKSYLDKAIDIGIYQVGFVSLINKTAECSDLFIDFEEITSKFYVSDGFLFERSLKDPGLCKCENYLYYNETDYIPFYLRRILGHDSDVVRAFVFQNNDLITNFKAK